MGFDKKGLLIVYSGPSGVGKGTVRKKVFEKLNNEIYYSISMTTRKIREGEQNGEDYWFVSKEEFEKQLENDNFLEFNKYVENYYGTPKDKVIDKLNQGVDVMLEIDVNGAKQVKEKMPESISIFIAPPSFEELKQRLIDRKTDSLETIEKRVAVAKKEVGEADNYDFFVVNETIDDVADEIVSIIKSEHLKAERVLKNYYKSIDFVK